MSFSVPNFNAAIDVWGVGTFPALNPPAIGGTPAQVYYQTRSIYFFPKAAGVIPQAYGWIRVPSSFITLTGTPIVGLIFGWTDSQGITWYYVCRWWDYAHAGFPNEYIEMLVEQCDNMGVVPDSNR
jgi:hypothetical protein